LIFKRKSGLIPPRATKANRFVHSTRMSDPSAAALAMMVKRFENCYPIMELVEVVKPKFEGITKLFPEDVENVYLVNGKICFKVRVADYIYSKNPHIEDKEVEFPNIDVPDGFKLVIRPGEEVFRDGGKFFIRDDENYLINENLFLMLHLESLLQPEASECFYLKNGLEPPVRDDGQYCEFVYDHPYGKPSVECCCEHEEHKTLFDVLSEAKWDLEAWPEESDSEESDSEEGAP